MAVDVEAARARLAERAAARQQSLDARFAEAWRDVRAIVEHIIARYPVRRIHQWGSLLNRAHFSARSDIDLALEGGLKAADFFALYGEADRMTRFPLDLVDIDHIEPEYADLIRQHGALVYDRDRPNPGPDFRS